MDKQQVTIEIGGDATGAEHAIQQSVDSLEKLRGEIRKPQGKIEMLERAERDLQGLQTELEEARRKLVYFREQAKLGGDIGAKAFAADIRATEREIDKLNISITKQSASVNKLGGDLRAAGLDTNNLSAEKARLAVQVDRADKAIIQLKGQLLAERDAAREAASQTQEAGRAAGDAASGADRFATGLKGIAAGIAALGVKNMVTDLAQTAEAYSNITGRLKVAVGENENLAKAIDLVSGAADASGSSLDATATLYARLYQSTRELGLSQQQVADLTETINKSFRVSGASSAEAEGAIRQLAQALASGVLRGDEFNSVMEQSPRLSQALADGLGVPIGSLREMAKEGKLTADVIIKALRDQSDAIKRDYSKMPETIGQAMQKLDNAWTQFIGKLNQSSGVTEAVAKAIGAVAENLDEIAKKAAFAGEVVVTALAIKAAGAVRAYIAEMVAATAATGGLATAATALSATFTKLAPLLRALGWAAVVVEVVELALALKDLHAEQEKSPKLSKDVAEAQERVRQKLAQVSQQTGITVQSMAELDDEVAAGRIHFDEASKSWQRGAGDMGRLNEKIEVAALAGKDLAEAYKSLIPQIEAASRVVRLEYDLKAANNRLAIEEQRTILEVARAKGDDVAARAAKIKIAELEIEQARLNAQADLASAEASLSAARAKLEQARASGVNVGAMQEELRAAELRVEAAKVSIKIVDEQSNRAKALANATDNVTRSNIGAASSFGQFAEGASIAGDAVNDLADAEQRLLDIRNAANAARQQGGSTPWEYLLGKNGVDLSVDQLAAFKSQIEGVYKYVSGTFDGKTVDQSYLLDEAIRRTLESVKRSGQSTGGISTPTAAPAAPVTSASGSGITIIVQGDALDIDGLAYKLRPALARADRLRS
jgi:tape measure domain-containing protein